MEKFVLSSHDSGEADVRPSTGTVRRRTRVLILGVNGFIGNHLTERLLHEDHYEVYGLDIGSDAISRFLNHPRFHFVEGDISIHFEWTEYHIKKCDIVLPLVAIATPAEYTRNPLRVFELDFEEKNGGNQGSLPDLAAQFCPPAHYSGSLKKVMEEVEQQYIEQIMKECGGRVTEAARRLGIHRTMLYRKLEKGDYREKENGSVD